MQKIIYIHDYKDKRMGDTDVESNNVAHGLITIGVAKLYTRELAKTLGRTIKDVRRNVMMTADSLKGDNPYMTK
jgi:hypothetical protein